MRTIVGAAGAASGMGLFAFGDMNGVGRLVRLQHALDVVFHQGSLYVADTYNSKIKQIDPVRTECKTFLGDEAGTFNEPGGLSVAGGKLYVADTSSHRIRVVDLESRRCPRWSCKACLSWSGTRSSAGRNRRPGDSGMRVQSRGDKRPFRGRRSLRRHLAPTQAASATEWPLIPAARCVPGHYRKSKRWVAPAAPQASNAPSGENASEPM